MYNINEVAVMTGLSTRTLRNYLKMGVLDGEKIDGVWQFSEEHLGEFLRNPVAAPSIQAKRNALIFDFLANRKKQTNEMCVVLDLAADDGEAEEVSDFFCQAVNGCAGGVQFAFEKSGQNVRVILTGQEECVQEIVRKYYG